MPASLAITIDGDGIELHSLARAVAGFAELLTSIGAEMAPGGVPPLKQTRNLAKLTGNGIRAIEVSNPADPGGASFVTPRTAENAAAALAGAGSAGGKAPGYENYGSVEGSAETFDLRGAPFFTVRSMLTGQPVRCYFGEEDREKIAGIVAGKRIVSVDGMLHRDRDGRLRRISPVLSFGVIDDPPSGDLESLAGLFRGIGDTREYLRRIRGG